MTDKELLEKVEKNGMFLDHGLESQKSIKHIVLAAVAQNGISLKYASDELKNDIDIVRTAVIKKGSSLYFASENLKNNKSIILLAIRKDGLALQHASFELKNDKEVALAAVSKNGLALEYVTLDLKNDKEVVLAAVSKNGLALKYTSSVLKNDEEVVLRAVSSVGKALKFASPRLKYNKKVVTQAVRKDGLSIEYADNKLRGDRDILLVAIAGWRNARALSFATDNLKNDLKFIKKAYEINIDILEFVSEDVKDNRDFILDIFRECGTNISYLSKRLRLDMEISFAHVSKNKFGIHDVSLNLLNSKEFISKIIHDDDLIKKHGADFLPRVLRNLGYFLWQDIDFLETVKHRIITTAYLHR